MGVALVAWWLESGVGWPVDANVIGVVILLDAVLGWAEKDKASQAMAALTRRKAESQDRSYILCGA